MNLTREFKQEIADLGTQRQAEVYEVFCEHTTLQAAADALGMSRQAITKNLKALEKKAIKAGEVRPVSGSGGIGAGRVLKKCTSHVKGGVLIEEWPRTEPDDEKLEENIKLIAAEFMDDIRGKCPCPPRQPVANSDLLSMYGLFDRHIGMLAWGEEAGADYDLKICEELESRVAGELLASQPNSAKALIALGGDFLHADDDSQLTPASGHKLDVDGRSRKVLRVAVRILKRMLVGALEKHQDVYVTIVSGNHDPRLTVALELFLYEYCHGNDRLHFVESRGFLATFEFGQNFLVFNHGDKMKFQKMYELITTDYIQELARCKHRYCFSGHWHRDHVLPIGKITFESMPTPIPNDIYAASHGYRSPSSAHALTFHITRGLIQRTYCNVD